jgi:hypothetical protein
MTDFIVRFEGKPLSPEASRHLQAAIGAAVESAMGLAAFQPDPEGDGRCVYIPHQWLGRWIIPQAELAKNPGLMNRKPTVEFRPPG